MCTLKGLFQYRYATRVGRALLRCDCVIQRIQALARPWCRRRQKYESRPTAMQRTRQREAQDTAWRHAKSRAEDGIAEGEGTRCPCRLSTPRRPSASRMAWRGMYVAYSIVRAMRARMIYVSCVIETIIHNHYGVVSRAVWLAAEITARIDILTCVTLYATEMGCPESGCPSAVLLFEYAAGKRTLRK